MSTTDHKKELAHDRNFPLKHLGKRASVIIDLNTGNISFGDSSTARGKEGLCTRRIPSNLSAHDLSELLHHGGLHEIAHEMSETWKQKDREHYTTLLTEFLVTLHAFTHEDHEHELVH